MTSRAIRILGIDPGLRRTGWGVIESDGNRLGFRGLRFGRYRGDAADLAARAGRHPSTGLSRVIGEYKRRTRPRWSRPSSTRTAPRTLKLGQARGIAMLVPALCGISVAEYAPNLVKKTVVGAGHAEKAQIRMMIGILLPKADAEKRRCRRRAGDRDLPRASPRSAR